MYQQIMNQIKENAMEAQDQEAYNRRVEPLYARYEALKAKTQKVRDLMMDRAGRRQENGSLSPKAKADGERSRLR